MREEVKGRSRILACRKELIRGKNMHKDVRKKNPQWTFLKEDELNIFLSVSSSGNDGKKSRKNY